MYSERQKDIIWRLGLDDREAGTRMQKLYQIAYPGAGRAGGAVAAAGS